MTSNTNDGSALFLAIPTPDRVDNRGLSFDDSEETMQRHRHPFAVTPAASEQPADTLGESAKRRH